MSEEESAADWAQLVCVTDADTPPFLIGKNKFTIGRAQSNDICHENNKLVSGTHCYIQQDESGKVWLYDTSTNGTLLNSKIKLSKGECRELQHGDEFFVVHKKSEDNVNIGYVFQDLARLKEEEEADDSREMDSTLEYGDGPFQADSTIADISVNQVDEEEPRSAIKRRFESRANADLGPSSKRAKADSTSDISSSASTTTATTITTTTTTTTADTTSSKKDEKREAEAAAKLGKTGIETEQKDTQKGEKDAEKDGKKEVTKSDGAGEGKKDTSSGEEDAFADTLTCIICQELLHDCISLQPCMHSFCSGCYSEWMAHSSECPSCRGTVDRINKNHIVNNLVEAYLKEHPEKRRPDEDIKELDAKNKVTRDMLYPKRRRTSSSEYDNSDVDEDDEPAPYYPPAAPAANVGTIFGFGTPLFGAASHAYRAVCRQCPASTSQTSGLFGTAINTIKNIFTGNQTTTATTTTATDTPTSTTATPSTSGNNNNNNNDDNNNNNNNAQPSTSGGDAAGDLDYLERDKKTMPAAPPYTCAMNQNHILCQCCLQIFPDRRIERNTQPEIPAQQCTICYRSYCHAYWGCRKADCNGCLAKFKDMNFGRKILPGLILENRYESEVFMNYLESKKLAVRDVLEASIAKMVEGSYSCPDQARFNMTGETPLCFACGLRNFKALAYQYRADIPRDQLPGDVTARADCYWGKNCRTQRSKPAHAMRFSHICEQTRT